MSWIAHEHEEDTEQSREKDRVYLRVTEIFDHVCKAGKKTDAVDVNSQKIQHLIQSSTWKAVGLISLRADLSVPDAEALIFVFTIAYRHTAAGLWSLRKMNGWIGDVCCQLWMLLDEQNQDLGGESEGSSDEESAEENAGNDELTDTD